MYGELDSGPEDEAGRRRGSVWRVPADFADKEVDVILTISDATEPRSCSRRSSSRSATGRRTKVEAPAEPAKLEGAEGRQAGRQEPPKEAKPSDLALKPAAAPRRTSRR